jgi:hypothetical protein
MKNIVTALTVFSVLLLSFPSLADTKMASYQTFCFGRYLIDVPTNAVLASSGNQYLSEDGIESKRMSKEDFWKMISEREKVLKQQTNPGLDKYFATHFANDKDKRMLVSIAKPFGDTSYGIDTYKFTASGYAITTSSTALDDKQIKDILISYEGYLNHVRYRSVREIPSEPGFCVDNGFVANDGKVSQNEQASLYFKLKDHPDVGIRVESEVNFKAVKPMLARIKEQEVGAIADLLRRVKSMRQGERVINGMHGEEALDRGPSDEQIGYAHSLAWETVGKVGDPLHPLIHFEIITGGAEGGTTTPSSMSDKEVIALYDRIVSTIRIRPTR